SPSASSASASISAKAPSARPMVSPARSCSCSSGFITPPKSSFSAPSSPRPTPIASANASVPPATPNGASTGNPPPKIVKKPASIRKLRRRPPPLHPPKPSNPPKFLRPVRDRQLNPPIPVAPHNRSPPGTPNLLTLTSTADAATADSPDSPRPTSLHHRPNPFPPTTTTPLPTSPTASTPGATSGARFVVRPFREQPPVPGRWL